jgi:hypothetical protein
VDAQCAVEFGDELAGQLPQGSADSLNGYRTDLFGLGLGVTRQPSLGRGQQNLEWIDPGRVRGHRDHRDDAPGKPAGCGVGRVIADDDGRPGLAGFRPLDRVEVDADDLAAPH